MEVQQPGESEQEEKVAAFMEIVGEVSARARQFLLATGWQLEEAIQLYFAGNNEVGGDTDFSESLQPVAAPSGSGPSAVPTVDPVVDTVHPDSMNEGGSDYVRPPLPVKREALYEDVYQYRAQRMAHTSNQPSSVDAFRNFEDEANAKAAWSLKGVDKDTSSAGAIKDSLAALYRPPFVLMFQGTFEQAKAEAARQRKWLLVNLQSTKEFSSYTLNRDLWAHEAVKETIGTMFVFWQVYDDTEEGRKVCTYYKLSSMPITLVLDPLTGLKMRAWGGMITPERLLEDLVPFMDKGPMEQQLPSNPPPKRPRESVVQGLVNSTQGKDFDEDEELQYALAASLEGVNTEETDKVQPSKGQTAGNLFQEDATVKNVQRPSFPVLPEEPNADYPGVCRVGVRFPDGKRGQRRFLRSDPIKFLWSFCCSQVKEVSEGRSFRLTHTIPGANDSLNYNSTLSIEESGVANTMLAMTWE
ncbi:hypothetical protein O6H91_18G082500 [Diphasiastrum complanatum]|uniref:Uncharacterized protein n=1 Tax=Diphasiastrum complanatum TaxID=34168 RepID=A0ACC2B381_DIPCM|nr:hypothetical protein O6H91_18G082500 [Diphasiastrum complanatum]